MITKIDKETLDFLGKKKLTFNQFAMCLMLYYKDTAAVIQYTTEVGYLTGGTIINSKGHEINELDDLVERGIVKWTSKDKENPQALDNYSVTSKFTVGFMDRYQEAADEFWKQYPDTFFIQGEEKRIAKSMDYDEFEEEYIKIITVDFKRHELMMKDVEVQLTKSKYASVGILKYIKSRPYDNVDTNVARKSRTY